jgi:hypothetical protein
MEGSTPGAAKTEASVASAKRKGGPRATTASTPVRQSPRIMSAVARAMHTSSGPADVLADPMQPARDAKAYLRGRTGFYYDERMVSHSNPWDPNHIESPIRLSRAFERCSELGLAGRCEQVPSREATDDEFKLVHTDAHVDFIKSMVSKTTEEIKEVCMRQYHSVSC